MRFSILLITLALLPVVMIIHGWIFTEKQLPTLRQQALAALQQNGIRSAVADLRYLDLRIAGNAADLPSVQRARAAVAAIGPLRLVADDLKIPASLHARLAPPRLTLEGWLPAEENRRELLQLLGKLRPDLTLLADGVQVDAQVRWPESEKAPLTTDSSLLAPIVEKLRVSPWLDITQDSTGLHAKGILPANGLRTALLTALRPGDAAALQESTHTVPASFAQPDTLMPFLTRFFASTSPRRLFINEQAEPLLQAAATRSQESEWLALLRPITGGKRVVANLTFYPSEYHFPGRRAESPLPPAQAATLAEALAGQFITFAPGSAALTVEEQARLAALTPQLLTAGPAARLIIGGHPESNAAPEKRLAKARADQVHSFLVEQGLPASDVQTTAFDPVPPGTPGAPSHPRSVEILLR